MTQQLSRTSVRSFLLPRDLILLVIVVLNSTDECAGGEIYNTLYHPTVFSALQKVLSKSWTIRYPNLKPHFFSFLHMNMDYHFRIY
jgi:hypothetical protein